MHWWDAGLFIAAHIVWVRHFLHTWHTLEYILGFFVPVVWAVPFGLFISLAANEQALPFDAGGTASRPGSYSSAGLLSGMWNHSFGQAGCLAATLRVVLLMAQPFTTPSSSQATLFVRCLQISRARPPRTFC